MSLNEVQANGGLVRFYAGSGPAYGSELAGRVEVPHHLRCRAAQYIRMSTDHQETSPLFQREAIAKYAAERGLAIVRTYADEGRSGLGLQNRDGLCALLRDVTWGRADYGVVLVYDVSRWGRFQDTDESAYYEYHCRRAGIRVEYCAEPFANDGTPMAAIIKNIKRVMAGEFSRELSQKVYAGKSKVIQMGFRAGGSAGFGLRRLLVDSSGRPRAVLEYGQQKIASTDRVVQVPGPANEVDLVRWVFRQVAEHRRSHYFLAEELNRRGVLTDRGRPWTPHSVYGIITNEKYIGNLVFNRTSAKLRGPRVLNPPEKWLRVDGAFQAIVKADLFRRANEVLGAFGSPISDEQALGKLRRLLASHGHLTVEIINSDPEAPASDFYRGRFGTLLNAYARIGFRPNRSFRWLEGHYWRWHFREDLRKRVPQLLAERGVEVRRESRKVIVVHNRWRIAVMLARFEKALTPQWQVQVAMRHLPDWVLIARLNKENSAVIDYWLVSGGTHFIMFGSARPRKRLTRYQADTLEPLLDLIASRKETGQQTAAKAPA